MRERMWREVKPFVGPAIVVVVYAIVRLVYTSTAGGRGVLTPAGSVDNARAVLGVAALGLRVVVVFGVPIVVVYRLVMRAARRWIDPA